MKKLLFLLLCIITFNCNAQYSTNNYQFKDIVPQTIILGTTFITVEYMVQTNVNPKTRTITAFTGIGLTLISHYTLKAIKKNTPNKIKKKRIKKCIYL